MKRFLLSLLLLAGGLSLHAQIDVTWGVPLKNPRKTLPSEILGADKDYFYVIRSSYKFLSMGDMSIEKYKRDDMSLVSSKPIDLEDATGHDRDFEGLYYVGGRFLLFTSQYDRNADKRTAYIQSISDDGTLSATKTIDEIPAEKKRNSGSYNFVLSEDSSKVLMIRNEPFEKYANEKFTFKVFNDSMNLVWEKALELPYKDKMFSLTNYKVDNDGNVYMLASIEKDQAGTTRKERRTKPQYYYNILFYDHVAGNLNEYVVNLNDKYISDINFVIDTKGDMVCAGFYSNKSSNALIGAFYLKINKATKNIDVKGFKDFEKDFLEQFMSAKKASKNKELYNYSLRDLVLRDDGGAILVAEQYYVVQVCTTDPKTGVTTCTYHYYYNDIIVVSIGADGKIAWSKKIPKYQHSVNDGGYYSSFAFSVSKNKMYFMYNDNPKSAALPLESTTPAAGGKKQPTCKPLNRVTKAVAMLVTVDSNGNMDRQVMFNNKDLKIILRPKVSMQVEEDHTFLYGQKGSTYKFADVKMQ